MGSADDLSLLNSLSDPILFILIIYVINIFFINQSIYIKNIIICIINIIIFISVINIIIFIII